MKTCTKCKETKPRSEFHNCASKRDGKFSACKVCRNLASKKYAERVGPAEIYRRAVARDPEAYRQKQAEYYRANKDQISRQARERRAKNIEELKRKRALDYQKNRERYIAEAARWARENKARRSDICRRYSENMKANKPEEWAARTISRTLLNRVLKLTGKTKRTKTEVALNYTKAELVAHIESQFLDGMSWSNREEWHIDHIIPVSELVRCGVTDPAKINALSNLRPMWAAENMAKSDHFDLAPPCAAHITRASR